MKMADLYLELVRRLQPEEGESRVPATCDVKLEWARNEELIEALRESRPWAYAEFVDGMGRLVSHLCVVPPSVWSSLFLVVVGCVVRARHKEYMIETSHEVADLLVEKLEGTIKMVNSEKKVFAFIPSATIDVIVRG